MKMLKKKDGFTLVELIVVIAILAILAGVAIPAYSGYIKKANATADITVLSAVKTACQAALATEGEVVEINVTEKNGETPASVVVKYMVNTTETSTTITTESQTGATDFDTFYGGEIENLELKTGSTAKWDNSADATAATKGEWVITE